MCIRDRGEQVNKRLECRSRRTGCECAIHLAGLIREVIFRTDKGKHVTGGVIEHYRGRIPQILRAQPRNLRSHDPLDGAVEIEMQGRPEILGYGLLSHHQIDKVRRAKETPPRAQLQWFLDCAIVAIKSDRAIVPHSPQHRLLSAKRSCERAVRIELSRIPW